MNFLFAIEIILSFFTSFKYLQIIKKIYSHLFFVFIIALALGCYFAYRIAREITHTKRIILESNRECGKGMFIWNLNSTSLLVINKNCLKDIIMDVNSVHV